jgi:HAE1 family hydrophobic/amphiphilic exporter-1
VRLSDTSIRRPVFAVMLVGGLMVLGLVSIPRMGIDLFPKVELPLVTVTATLRGASPETMEREVTQVIEEAVNTIEGIRSLRSASSDGLSLAFVEFELSYDIQEKAQQVRERVAGIRAELPPDIDPPVIDRVDPEAVPILAILISGPYDIRGLTTVADERLKPRLERIAGVGSVSLMGDRPREIRIWIDPLRLTGHGLGVDDVLAAVRREHVELPGGRIETERSEYLLKTHGKFRDPMGLGSIAVAERGGNVVHLRDVATIEDGMAEERSLSRLNGRRGVALMVRKQSGENTVAVAEQVRRVVDELRPSLPEGFEMVIAFDSSVFIVGAIKDVAMAIAWGAVLASLVVLVFLRNLRSTVIVAVTIPVSIISTFVFFYLFDFTLNTMTLTALSLSIGLLIDDAIVVLENIYRHSEEGESGAVAASRGAQEIGLAVIATTLANCAVFVPIAFLSGVVGRFFREFGLVAACAVATSTLVALSLTPMLCSRYLRPDRDTGKIYGSLERGYGMLERYYRRLLVWGLEHRPTVVGLALASTVAGVVAAGAVEMDFLIPSDRSEFNIWVKMPLGSTLTQTQQASMRVEEELMRQPEVVAAFATVGSVLKKRVNESLIYVQLHHKREREATQAEVMSRIRRWIPDLGLPFEDFAVEEIGTISTPGSRHADLMYSVRGPDIGRLHFYARSLMERMRQTPGYADVFVSYELGKPEVSLEIERDRAADLGVSALQIGRTVSAYFAGVRVATFEDQGERYDIRLQVRPELRDEIGELGLVRVRSARGALIPLENVVRPRIGSGPVQIDRESRTRAITIYGNLEGKAAGEADLEVSAFAQELGIEGAYEFHAVGPSKRLRETASAIQFAFMLALVAIYMILAAQFNSFVHPLTIMLSAPLSFIGAFAALLLSGTTLDVMGQIAFLMLMGIVMKNGILLVDYINTLRGRGRSLREAILEAGPTRMRPVLMTAVSTIFGLLPLALGNGDGSEFRSPMGIVTIGGLATSTLLTLWIVPVVYSLIDDAQSGVLRLLGLRVETTPAVEASGVGDPAPLRIEGEA